MDQENIEQRMLRLEQSSHRLTIVLGGVSAISIIALIIAVKALLPFLILRHALSQMSGTHESPNSQTVTRGSSGGSITDKEQPSLAEEDQDAKLQSILSIAVQSMRLLPKDYEAGRYSPAVELTLQADNKSDRQVRAYEGSLDTDDLLGNRIIVLEVKDQTPVAPHRTHTFKEYFEINQFSDRDTTFAAQSYGNLRFNWKPKKIIFADGTSADLGE